VRPEQITTDLRERRFAEHTVQLAIQACLDLSSQIVADERLGEPETYAELFTLLASRGFIPSELAARAPHGWLPQSLGAQLCARKG
jgi:uncharacterized protein YutE (UPF0331/DUF86 family)